MGFIIEFPLTTQGHTGIVVFVDRLTNLVRLVQLKIGLSISNVIDLLINEAFRHHGLTMDLLIHRDPRFTSAFFCRLTKLVGSPTKDN